MSQNYRIGTPYYAVVQHVEHKSQNRMHEDGLPQKLGFRGAFVLGVGLYGYMTRALVATLGEAWLGRAVNEVKFIKPVCAGDRVRVATLAVAGTESEHEFEVTMFNETAGGEISAKLTTSMPASLPPVDPTAAVTPNEWEGPVTQRRTWDNIVVGKAYRSLHATLTEADNADWTRMLDDDLPIYRGDRAPIHPALVLRQVQLGYNNQFIGESAIHSSGRAVIRRMLRVGDEVQVLTVPTAKWEKKENHWLTVYCAVRSGGEVCSEIFHNQIIRLRGAGAEPASVDSK